MDTSKKEYWQKIVFTETGVTAGAYDNPRITVDSFGRITDVQSVAGAETRVVSSVSGLNTIGNPAEGDIAVVLNGSNGAQEIHIYRSGNWIRVGSSDTTATNPVGQRGVTLGASAASANVGEPLPQGAIVERIKVEVKDAYPVDSSIRVQLSRTNTVLVETTEIDAQLPGLYIVEAGPSEFDTAALNDNQVVVNRVGPTVSSGSVEVSIEYRI